MAILQRPSQDAPLIEPSPIRTVEPTEHDRMAARAQRWLRTIGCGAVVGDPWRTPMVNESPDAIGWRDGLSVLVEVKTSRADFRVDANKPFRLAPELGMGDWRFYMAPEGVIRPVDIPTGWGLIEVKGKSYRICNMINFPANGQWHSDKPFTGNKNHESIFLSYALKANQEALRKATIVA